MRWNFCLALVAAALTLAGCADVPPQKTAPLPPASPSAPGPMPDSMPELLHEIESSYRAGQFDRGLSLVKHALELKKTDISTFDRIGSVYYVLGRYGDALSFWSRALPLEDDADRRAALERSISSTRSSLGLSDPQPAPAAPTPPPIAKKRSDPADIDRLYRAGIKYYAEGQYLQATDAFLRILDQDPDNRQAQKALERLRHESGTTPP